MRILRGADLRGADLLWADLKGLDVDLRGALNLDVKQSMQIWRFGTKQLALTAA